MRGLKLNASGEGEHEAHPSPEYIRANMVLS